ncbi:hypothetical protein Scep_001048 [Stephania cephalantha]|uniref:Cytochrome P450 n=1 Tax=Stephania cephalantha TaxID=152367 RepID=A0AAP0L8Q9_9MAGN
MELLFLGFLLSFFLLFYYTKLQFHTKKNLPPSPPSLPILGHLHLTKKPLHRTLHTISNKYGPVVLLHFGSLPVLLVSSPSAIEECFIKNDIIFAQRPQILAGSLFSYDFTTLGWAPYGQHWRDLRRIMGARVFSPTSLEMSSAVRFEEIMNLVGGLFGRCSSSSSSSSSSSDVGKVKVDMKSLFFRMTFDVVMRIVVGKRCFGDDEGENKRMMEFVRETLAPAMPMTLGDFLPLLRWFRVVKEEREMVHVQKKRDEFLQSIVDEYKSLWRRTTSDTDSSSESREKTLMDYLLSLQEEEPQQYTDQIVKGLVLMMFTAGTDTTAVTMEWAMSLLLDHPEALYKARNEIDAHLTSTHDKSNGHHRLLQESDLANLPYLHNIIQETLRLHPAAPLLVPHSSSQDCTVGGYHVPRGTVLLANAWAVHRDPQHWVDPTEFRPERFDDDHASDVKCLIPFGMGRRKCPGVGLAMREMALCLGILIQCFEWEKVGDDPLDMSEGGGLTVTKNKALEATCWPRQTMLDVLSRA